MTIRPDVAALLEAGYGNLAIARRCAVSTGYVQRSRTRLGIPHARRGHKTADSVEDLFWRRVEHADNGHITWAGHHTNKGTPVLSWGGRGGTQYTAFRVAFRIRHGREPEGFVRPHCGLRACVAPDHVSDRRMRDRDTATFNAIFGGMA